MRAKEHYRVPSKISRKINTEKEVANNLLDGFIARGSKGELLIERVIGIKINQITLTGLTQIAKFISELSDTKFPRNYKRKKDLIVKWFDDNHDIIESYISNIQIVYTISNSAI